MLCFLDFVIQNFVWRHKGSIRYLVVIMLVLHSCALSFFPMNADPICLVHFAIPCA